MCSAETDVTKPRLSHCGYQPISPSYSRSTRLKPGRTLARQTVVHMSMNSELLGFFNFVHRPVFQKLENTTFRKLDLFPSSGEGEEAPAVLGT
jgi:hypothetical protein